MQIPAHSSKAVADARDPFGLGILPLLLPLLLAVAVWLDARVGEPAVDQIVGHTIGRSLVQLRGARASRDFAHLNRSTALFERQVMALPVGSAPALARLLALEPDGDNRRFLISALREVGGDSAADVLARHLKQIPVDPLNPQPEQERRWAFQCLGRMGGSRAFTILAALLVTGPEDWRISCLRALRSHPRRLELEEELARLALSQVESIRGTAILCLSGRDDPRPGLSPRSQELLVRLAGSEENPSVRASLAYSLGSCTGTEVEAAIASLLTAKEKVVRKSAIEALGHIGSHTAGQRLLDHARVELGRLQAMALREAREILGEER